MILALDVGERRIGVAVTDASETFALPVQTLDRVSIDKDLAAIAQIASEYAATVILVGDPISLSGERGIAAKKMDGFCVALARIVMCEIVRVDERLTTAQANRTLLDADVSRAKRKRVVDRLAATLILEHYLARRKFGREREIR